jgi:3-methyladenine DNA glycosylase AlkD
MLNKLQEEIVEEFKTLDQGYSRFNLPKYLGTKHKVYAIKTAVAVNFSKDFLKRHKDISRNDFLELLNLLYKGESFNERIFGNILISRKKEYKDLFTPQRVYTWASGFSGWCEIDCLCAGVVSAEEMLKDWDSWEKAIKRMVGSKNISLRRASLVLFVKPVRERYETKFSNLAFSNIEILKHEKDILITKAVSWILRSLIKNHRQEVILYLEKNRDSLPKIAVRETERKLSTGKNEAK